MDVIYDGQGEILGDSEKNPFFEDFLKLFPTFFESFGVGINAVAFDDLSVVCAVIRKDFIFGVAQRRLDVVQQHEDEPPIHEVM
jgi:hypothetical protein